MAYPANDSTDVTDLSQIDLSSALDFMDRNKIARMDMTIEAVGIDPSAPMQIATGVAVIEKSPIFTDNEPPSQFGLMGVFFVVGED